MKTRARVQIKGDIISNEYKQFYDYYKLDSTCPKDINDAISSLEDGEDLLVSVNSGGGMVTAGQEIYSLLKRCPTSRAEIEGIAGSAAGVAAMGANHVSIYPVGIIMIHNVSVGGASGDYHDMHRYSNMLLQMNKAMCAAYTEKSGKTLDEIMKLMDKESWITANQALEYGFADEIITDRATEYTNNIFGLQLTEEMKQQALAEMAVRDERTRRKNELMQAVKKYL